MVPQILPFSFGEDTMNTGDSTSLMCSISKGDLPIEIFWFHNNRTLKPDGNIAILKTSKKISTLSFDSLQAEHIGQYTCLAKNQAGFTRFSTYLSVNGIVLVF